MLATRARRTLVVLIAVVVALASLAAIATWVIAQHQRPLPQQRLILKSLQPQAVLRTHDPYTIGVGVVWTQPGWCVGQFHVQASETATQVRLGTVISREYVPGTCAGVGTVYNMAWPELILRAALGARTAVRASDGIVLPICVSDRAIPSCSPTTGYTP